MFCALMLSGCSSNPQIPAPSLIKSSIPPIRFLLTFDDGPSGATYKNSTEQILDVLAKNEIQPDIKAVFFVQIHAAFNGSKKKHSLLVREHAEGHLLAFHTTTPRHANHRFLKPEDLEFSLQRGIEDLTKVSGSAPQLVRPPFWNYDERTLESYHRHGLKMLLTDLSANDGKIYGVNWSWHKRSNLLAQLRRVKADWADGNIPTVNGHMPVVVTLHDLNRYTARTIEVYLRILLQVAHELDMPVAAKPFYDNRTQLEKAALARTVKYMHNEAYIPGVWGWLWR
jgi:peptidoglycan/xylan/chitin deacetylase (PgdA/CDA1 family)